MLSFITEIIDKRIEAKLFGGFGVFSLMEILKKVDNKNLPVVWLIGEEERPLVNRVNSYRGYYEHLFIEYDTDKIEGYEEDEEDWEPRYELANVSNLLLALENRAEKGWFGYKGGEYQADTKTKIFIETYGGARGNLLVGVEVKKDRVLLVTEKEKDF